MLTVIIIMCCGMFTGYLFRNIRQLSKTVGIIITWAIYLLLFLLGISVGSNSTITDNIGKIGFNAFIITFGALTGSVIAAWFTYTIFFRSNEK